MTDIVVPTTTARTINTITDGMIMSELLPLKRETSAPIMQYIKIE